MINMKRLLALSLCLALLLPARLAFGVFGVADVTIVSDPAGIIQQTATAARAWLSNANEALGLENQVKQLANDAQNLLKLPLDLVNEVNATMAAYQSMLAAGKGIVFSVEQSMADFDRIYNGKGSLMEKATGTLNALRQASATATRAQAIYDLLCSQSTQVGQLLAASQASSGNLQAAQATNQLLGVIAAQNAANLEMAAATGRGQIAYFMRQTTAEEAAMQEGARYQQATAPDWDHREKRGRGLPE